MSESRNKAHFVCFAPEYRLSVGIQDLKYKMLVDDSPRAGFKLSMLRISAVKPELASRLMAFADSHNSETLSIGSQIEYIDHPDDPEPLKIRIHL